MPKGVTYNQQQADLGEAIADALAAKGVIGGGNSVTTTTSLIATTGSGDKTILTPTTGKALRISSFYIIADSQVGITLKKTAIAISGVMSITELAAEPTEPICLAADQTFVINVATAVNINGFVVWWEV